MAQNPGHACLILPYSQACHKILDMHASCLHTIMHATRSWTCMLHTLILSCMPQDPRQACIILPYSHACHKILATLIQTTKSFTCMLHTSMHSLIHATRSWICMPHTFMQAPHSSCIVCMHTCMHAMGQNSGLPCLIHAVKHTAKSRLMYASLLHNPKRVKFFIYLLSSESNYSYTQNLNFPVPMYNLLQIIL
jgi:hypothetical protein